MHSVTIVFIIGWLLAPGASHAASSTAFAPPQQTSQANAPPAPAAPTPPAAAPPKPCPAAMPSAQVPSSNCTPPAKIKKHRHRQPATSDAATGPTRKVVRDGGTTDQAVAISAGASEQQLSQQRDTTKHLLAMTDENLKTIESRPLNVGQQDTIRQIRGYMEQSRAAADSGDVQRAYTLANKARMLSGDLVKH